jgi:hypothetical protein
MATAPLQEMSTSEALSLLHDGRPAPEGVIINEAGAWRQVDTPFVELVPRGEKETPLEDEFVLVSKEKKRCVVS